MNTLIALYIILGILAFIAAICFLRIHFVIECNDEITAKLKILCIKISLYPQNNKKPKARKFKKGYPKEKKKNEKKQPTTSKKKKNKSDIALGEKIGVITNLVKILFSRFFKHLRLDVSKILITVGGSDAAACAITYGVVSQATAYLLEYLDNNIKISKKRRGEINVLCDFTAESTVYDISLSASLSVWQILDIGITLAYNYFKGKDIFNLIKNNPSEGTSNGRK